MNELSAVDTFLYSTLTTDPVIQQLAGNRVYADLAPEGAASPYIIFSLNAERSLGMIGTCERVVSIPDYTVKAVAKSASYSAVERLANAIEHALVGAHGEVVSDGQTVQINAVYRVAAIRYGEQDGPDRYKHLGGIFRMRAHVP